MGLDRHTILSTLIFPLTERQATCIAIVNMTAERDRKYKVHWSILLKILMNVDRDSTDDVCLWRSGRTPLRNNRSR